MKVRFGAALVKPIKINPNGIVEMQFTVPADQITQVTKTIMLLQHKDLKVAVKLEQTETLGIFFIKKLQFDADMEAIITLHGFHEKVNIHTMNYSQMLNQTFVVYVKALEANNE